MSDDQTVRASTAAMDQLRAFLFEPKFIKYTGQVWDGGKMVSAGDLGRTIVNELIQQLLVEVPRNPRKSVVLAAFANALNSFPHETDTEDREEFLSYFETVMDILGIESSDGLLMKWMYGDEIAITSKPPTA